MTSNLDIYRTANLSIFYCVFFASLLFGLDAQAACRTVEKQVAGIKVQHVEGTADCVMPDLMKRDKMIAGYYVEGDAMYLIINNIRNGKDINLDFYGFTKDNAAGIASGIDDVNSVLYVKRYNSYGIPDPKLEKRIR